MSNPVTFSPADTSLLKAVFQSKNPEPLAKARRADEIAFLLSKWDNGNGVTDTNELLHQVLDYRNSVDTSLTEGRKSFPLDTVDDVTYGLWAAKVITDAAGVAGAGLGTLLAPGAGTAIGGALGKLGGDMAKAFVEDMKAGMELPFAKDLIKDYRTNNAGDALLSFTSGMQQLMDPAVEAMAEAVNSDQTGVLGVVAAACYQAEAGGLASLPSSPGAVANAHPELFNNSYVKIIVNGDDSAVIEDINSQSAALTEQIAGVANQVSGSVTEIRNQLGVIIGTESDILGGQKNVMKLLLDQQKATAAQQKRIDDARASATLIQSGWAAAQATVSAAAAIAGLFNKKLAGEISQVGTAVIQTGQCAVAFVNAVATLSEGVKAVSALGAATATGNLIGAVVGLASLFTPTGPSPELLMDQQILSAIGGVQKSLDNLGQDMGKHFAVIDKELSALFTATMDGLSRIANTVGLTYDQVLQIRQDLVVQRARLTELQQSLNAFMQSAERLDLFTLIDGGLDYAQRTTGTAMSADQFNTYSSGFHTWATIACFDQGNQPLAGRSTADADLAGELDQLTLADNASYLDAVLRSRGLPGIASPHVTGSAPLPNIEVWRIAALSFAQLCAEWPALADTPGTLGRSDEIARVGMAYQAATTASASQTNIVSSLVEQYRGQLTNWAQAMDNMRHDFERHTLPSLVHRDPNDPHLLGPVDIYLGQNQALANRPATIQALSAAGPPLDLPASVMSELPQQLFVADALSEPNTRTVHANWYLSEKIEPIPDPLPDPGPGPHPHPGPGPKPSPFASVRRRWTLHIALWWGDTFLGQKNHEIGVMDTQPEVAPYWTQGLNMQGQIAKTVGWSYLPLPQSALDAATQLVNDRLAWARGQFYAFLSAQSGPSGSLGTPSVVVDGLRRAIENYVRLVWPEVRSGDDAIRAIFDGPPPVDGCRLPGRDDVLGLLTTIDPTLPPNTLVDWASTIAQPACDLLAQRIAQWVSAIQTSQYSNTSPTIQPVLTRLSVLPDLLAWNGSIAGANPV